MKMSSVLLLHGVGTEQGVNTKTLPSLSHFEMWTLLFEVPTQILAHSSTHLWMFRPYDEAVGNVIH